MPTPYFSTIPYLSYDMLADKTYRATVNILQRLKIRDVIKADMMEMYEYIVKDGERAEDIAFRYYGWTGYHWIILLANDIYDPYRDWPMSGEDLIAFLRGQYSTPTQDGLIYSYQTVHHYEDANGIGIDYDTYVSLPVNERKRVTLYDYWTEANEAKRHIRLIDKKYLSLLEEELIRLMKENPLR